MWLRLVLMTMLGSGCIVGMGVTLGATTIASFAFGIVLFAASVYGIVRLLQEFPREA